MNQTVKSPLIDTILRIAVLFLLIAWCIGIIRPFLEPVIWGAVIAIGLHPFFAMVKRWLGNRNTLAGVLLTLMIASHPPAANRLACQIAGRRDTKAWPSSSGTRLL